MSDTAPIDPNSAERFIVTEDADHGRFIMRLGGEIVGFAVYREQDGVVVIPHVETVARHRGRGYGARLVEGLLDIIRTDGRRVRPLCSFAAGHIADNEQFHDLLA